jgi:hydroxyacylglutathione hydrolase
LSDIPTLPSNLKKELKINPFLRCGHADIKERIIKKFDAKNNDLEIFTALRKWKDNF